MNANSIVYVVTAKIIFVLPINKDIRDLKSIQ